TQPTKDQGLNIAFANNQIQLNRLLSEISYYRHNGLISQLDTDMGDTLQRTGSYYTLLHFLNSAVDDQGRPLKSAYQEDINQLTTSDGIYRRSNDPGYWGFDSENCSRDQLIAAQTAIVTFKDFKRGRSLFVQFLKRGLLNQNTRNNWSYPWQNSYSWKFPDLPTPSQLSLLLRGLGSWTVYPAVFVLDFFILADVKYFRSQNERQLWDYDIKLLPILIASNSYMSTPWSLLGMRLYIQQRSDITRRIYYYNQSKFNGILPLAGIYALALDKIQHRDSSALPKTYIQANDRSPSNFK
ncbi:MAG: hypothetical protein KDD45_01210, partial [Bdellovibrionales bacterium]|nr:hypothetical protein [Bdellovibrionales bacterium]